MRERDLRIFIGPTEIANIGAMLASAFRERGVKVTAVSIGLNPFQAGMEYDRVLDFRGLNRPRKMLRYMYYFWEFFTKHNTFIFLFGNSLLPYNLDLPILKLFRKKTIVWFLGSDIRHYDSLAAATREAGIKYFVSKDQGAGPEALKRKLRMIRMVERYADHIISYPGISQLLMREYNMLYVPLDIGSVKYNSAPNQMPLVVHAPSDSEIKGTSYVLEAIERLKSEGHDFGFRLFQSTSNTVVREALSDADIAVDQLFASGAGMFALESMAAGCAVLGGNVPTMSGLPEELPVIHTDPDSIYENLKMLLENPELRRELGEKGRRYVEKYHDHRKIADDFIRLITKGEADITYTPRQNRTPQ